MAQDEMRLRGRRAVPSRDFVLLGEEEFPDVVFFRGGGGRVLRREE